MQYIKSVFLIIAIFILSYGCSDNPSTPELNNPVLISSSLEKSTTTYFSGESTSLLPPVDMGKSNTLPNGRVQVRGFLIDTEDLMDDSRVTGIVNWVVHWNEYYNEEGEFIRDVRWGTGVLVIPDVGRWDMTYKGWANPEDGVTYEVDGHGKGDLKGLKAHWTYRKPLVPGLPFDVNGYIIEK